ncbi:MAG: methyltransferase [Myxococcota bacterium]
MKRAGVSGATRLLKKGGYHEGTLVIDAPASEVGELAGEHFSFFEGPKGTAPRATGPIPTDAARWTLFLPKGKARRDWLFRLAAARGVELSVVGPAKGGIKAAKKALLAAYASVRTVAVGHHHQLLRGSGPRAVSADADQLVWSTGLGFDAVSLPGTFAAGRLDEGTARLIEVLASGDWQGCAVLDLACGSGVIGVQLARAGAEVVLSDADHLACESARQTLVRANVQGEVRARWAYDRIEGVFDAIVTNPPFHEGLGTSYDPAEAFVKGAPAKLRPGGTLTLVANHFLPYERWLEQAFGTYASLYEDKRFKVLRAVRP